MAVIMKTVLVLISLAAASKDVCQPGEDGESCAINKDESLEVESATVSLLQSKLETARVKMQVEEKKPDSKQLPLTQKGNSSRGCEWCHCFIQSGAECGWDYVSDAAVCGYDYVTDGAKCGWDWVTDAGKCGVNWVTDGASCGWDTVTSGSICGFNQQQKCGFFMQENATVSKSEHQADDEEQQEGQEENKKDSRSLLTQRLAGRRRRRKNWFKKAVKSVTCWVESTAKSCSVAKSCNKAKSCNVAKSCNIAASCNVGKSCDVAESFRDCFNEIKDEAKKSINTAADFMDLITDTGCSSLDNCAKKVEDGLMDVFDKVMEPAFGAIQDTVVEAIEAAVPHAKDFAGTLVDGVETLTNQVADTATSVGEAFGDYINSNFAPLDFGDCCLTGDKGIWYMMPKDCGAFTSMGKVFSDPFSAEDHFKDSMKGFKECVQLTGMLGVPTPFFELKFADFCIPDYIITPMEYIGGAVKLGGAAADDLVGSITGLIDQIQDFANNNMDIALLGKTINKRRSHPHLDHHEIVNMSLAEHKQSPVPTYGMTPTFEGSDDCGSEKDWTVSLTISWAVAYKQHDGTTHNFGFSLGFFVGCRDDHLFDPAPLFGAYMSNPTIGGIPKAKDVGASTSFSAGMWYGNSYFQFGLGGQASIFNTFDLTLKGDVEKITGKTIPVDASINCYFPYPPIAAPSGFLFTLAPAVKAEATLDQSDARLTKTLNKHGDKISKQHVMAAISHGVKELKQKNIHHEMKSLFSSSSKETTLHNNAVHTALIIDKHSKDLAKAAQQVKSGPKPTEDLLEAEDGEVKASAGMAKADKAELQAATPINDGPLQIGVGGSMNLMLCLEFPCRGQGEDWSAR